LVKQWRCADKRHSGKSISQPETDASWPFGYEGFFEFGARYRYRVRVETGYGKGTWSKWTTAVPDDDDKYSYSRNKTKYAARALEDAAEWTLYRPFLNSHARLEKFVSYTTSMPYHCGGSKGPCDAPYVPNADELVLKLDAKKDPNNIYGVAGTDWYWAAELLGSLQERGGQPRLNDTFLEVYLQDRARVVSGAEVDIRHYDRRWIAGYTEPDDATSTSSTDGFMKSPQVKLNTSFARDKMTRFLNSTTIPMDKHLVATVPLNHVTKVSDSQNGGQTRVIIKKSDVQSALGDAAWAPSKHYIVCVAVRNRGPLRSVPLCLGTDEQSVSGPGMHTPDTSIQAKGCPRINQTLHPSFKPTVSVNPVVSDECAHPALHSAENCNKVNVSWPNALDSEIGHDYTTISVQNPTSGEMVDILTSEVEYELQVAVLDGPNHKFDPDASSTSWTTLHNSAQGSYEERRFSHCPWNQTHNTYGPCHRNWSPSSVSRVHRTEHANLVAGKVYVYRLSIKKGLGGDCDYSITDYSKPTSCDSNGDNCYYGGVYLKYSVLSEPFQYNGTLASPDNYPSVDEDNLPPWASALTAPPGGISDIEFCAMGSGCAGSSVYFSAHWEDTPRKLFMFRFSVPDSGSTSDLLYRLEAERLKDDSGSVEASTSIRFGYHAVTHGGSQYPNKLEFCVSAPDSGSDSGCYNSNSPVLADSSFLQVGKQYRFRVRAERHLRDGSAETGAWSPWTTTEDGAGVLLGAPPPGKEITTLENGEHGYDGGVGFSHLNAVVLEFDNHFKVLNDADDNVYSSDASLLEASLNDRKSDSGHAPEGVLDGLRYDVYRFDLGRNDPPLDEWPMLQQLPDDFAEYENPVPAQTYLLKSLTLREALANEPILVSDVDDQSGSSGLHPNPKYNGNPRGSMDDVHRVLDTDVQNGHQYAYRVALRNRGRWTKASPVFFATAAVDPTLDPYQQAYLNAAAPSKPWYQQPGYGWDIRRRRLGEVASTEDADAVTTATRRLQSFDRLNYRLGAAAYSYTWTAVGGAGGCRTWSIASVNSFGSSDFNSAGSYCSVCVPGSSGPGVSNCTQVDSCSCAPGIPLGMLRPTFTDMRASSSLMLWSPPRNNPLLLNSTLSSNSALTGYNLRVRAVYSGHNTSAEVSLSVSGALSTSYQLNYTQLEALGLQLRPNPDEWSTAALAKEHLIEARVQAINAQGVSAFSEWSLTNANQGRALDQPPYLDSDQDWPVPSVTVGHDAADATKIRVELKTPFPKWTHVGSDWAEHLTHEVIIGYLGEPDSEESYKDPSSSMDEDELPLTTVMQGNTTTLVQVPQEGNFSTTNDAATARRDADDASKFDAIFRKDGALKIVCVLRWPDQVCELDSSTKILAPAFDADASVLGAFSFKNYVLGARPYPAGTPNNVNYTKTSQSAGIQMNKRYAFKVRAVNRAGASAWSRA
jgi:hypothetical protein